MFTTPFGTLALTDHAGRPRCILKAASVNVGREFHYAAPVSDEAALDMLWAAHCENLLDRPRYDEAALILRSR